MKIKVKNSSSCVRELAVTMLWEDIEEDYLKEFNNIKANYTPPGGRKGKVRGPALALFKKNYTQAIEAKYTENSIDKYYKLALNEHKLIPVNQGKIIDLQFKEGSNLFFKIEFEVKSEVKLPNYKKKFKISAVKYIPNNEDLEQALKDMQKRYSTMKSINSGAGNGHFLFVDLQELDDKGLAIVGKKMEKQYIKLGFGVFKDQALNILMGIKKDESRKVMVKIQDKEVSYEIKVHKIEEQIIPDLDNKFAKSVDPDTKDMNELCEKYNKNIKNSFDAEHYKLVSSEVIKYFVDKSKLSAPDSMVQNYLEHAIKNQKKNNPNMTKDQENEIRKSLQSEADFNVKWYLIKEQLVEDEGIDVSSKEVKDKIKTLVETDPQNKKQMVDYFNHSENEQQLYSELLNEKLFKFLQEYAVLNVIEKSTDELRKMQGENK